MPTQLTAARLEVLVSDGDTLLTAARTEALTTTATATLLSAARLEVLVKGGFLLTAARLEVLIEIEIPEAESMSCAGLPASYFIVPDPFLAGEGNIVSVTSEQGAYAGSASAKSTNLGKLLPIQSGRVTETAVDVRYVISEAGGVDGAEFLYRREADTGSDFFGADDPRHFRGQHHPDAIASSPGGKNSAIVYSTVFRKVIVIASLDTDLAFEVTRRDVDTARFDEWDASASNTFDTSIATGDHNLSAVELPDGRLLMAARVGASTHDFDIYQSSDGGASWVRTSRDIIARTGAALSAMDLDCQIRLARSGEHLRLAWIVGGNLNSLHSSDRGATWSATADALAIAAQVGITDDPRPFDIVGVDDSGLFMLNHLTGTTSVVWKYARTDAVFALTTVPSSVTSAGSVVSIVNVRTPAWLYVWVLYSDLAAAKADAWEFYRIRPADALPTEPPDWQIASPIAVHEGMTYLPGRVQTAWTGNEIVFWGSSRDAGAVAVDGTLGQLWYWGGWDQRSMGRDSPSHVFKSTDSPLWQVQWHCGLGFPTEPVGSTWSVVTVGTSVKVSTRLNLAIAGIAVADELRYNIQRAAGVWLDKAGFYWRMRLDTGDSTLAADDVGVRIRAYNGSSASIDVSVRHAPTGLRLIDNENAGATLADLAVTLDTGAGSYFTEIRLWMQEESGVARLQLIAYDIIAGVWVKTAVVNPTRQTGAPFTNSEFRFGHLGQTQATAMNSWWREVGIAEENTALQGGAFGDVSPTGQTNPDDLFGWQTSASIPTAIADGLNVIWTGSGGVRSDAFLGSIDHQHPAEAVLVDSPRIDWRDIPVAGGPLTTTTVILDADPVNGIDRFTHDAIAIYGMNSRTVTIDYDDNVAFSSPTTAETLDATAFGGTVFSVLAPAGTVLKVSGIPTIFTDGECAGMYVRMTSGGAIGKTFKVTSHRSLILLHMGDEATSLASQGVAAADSFVLFRSSAALEYVTEIGGATVVPQRYMRLQFTDTDTAEDDHRCGTIVPGTKLPIDVPLDWAHTDNQQPNVTKYRTRGAIQWAFREGPKQRTIVGRLVGDANKFRDRMRFVFGQIDFEAKPVALVIDDTRPDMTILGRLVSGSQHDNAAWYKDTDTVLRTAGDQSIRFEEEV